MVKTLREILDETPGMYDYILDRAISDDGYGIVAGRSGLGKTNLLLNLAFSIALGKPFLGLKTKKMRVLYVQFEGGLRNLQDRLMKIMVRGEPEKGYLDFERVTDKFSLIKDPKRFRDLIRNYDVIIIDPIKWFVGGRYIEPAFVTQFTATLLPILKDMKKIVIMAAQVRKTDPRHKVEKGDLESVKGAGDIYEDATFVILLEQTELRGKNIPADQKKNYLTVHWPKAREDEDDSLKPIDVYYEYSTCEFRVL